MLPSASLAKTPDTGVLGFGRSGKIRNSRYQGLRTAGLHVLPMGVQGGRLEAISLFRTRNGMANRRIGSTACFRIITPDGGCPTLHPVTSIHGFVGATSSARTPA